MSEVTAYLYNCTPIKPGVDITWSVKEAKREFSEGSYNRVMPEGKFPVSGRIYANKNDAQNARAQAGVDFVVYEIKFEEKADTIIGTYEDPDHKGVKLLEISKDTKPTFVRAFNGHGTIEIEHTTPRKDVALAGIFNQSSQSILQRAQAAKAARDVKSSGEVEHKRSGPSSAA